MAWVGKTIPHDSAVGHVTGQAEFIDDITPRRDELFVSFIGSPVTCGELLSIEPATAEQISEAVALFTSQDIEGTNDIGPVFQDEPFLAERKLQFLRQPVAVIAAASREALASARAAVRVRARPEHAILTVEQAIERRAFIGPARRIRQGDPDKALAEATHVLTGTFDIGGQEQFYFESQAAIAYPGEDSQLVIHSSTQNPTEIQAVVAEVLGIGQHQVVCICKRMGGAFGGKETQAALPAVMAALVANKTGRPARVVYDKDDDMRVTGKRHAYQVHWPVGFADDGRIQALKADFYSDGGAAADLSVAVMERTMLHVDNAYYLPDVEINGQVCYTNKPPNTAFRGFGGPQAVATIENIVESIATHLSMDAYDVRIRNVYGVGERNITPYGQTLDQNHLPEIFATLAIQSKYKRRLAEIKESNAESKLQLRGISMTAVKFGISFTNRTLNQGNAFVNVYTDGTVQVSTGGTEMGQGLNTKIRQLVADDFGIDPLQVLVMTTSTEKNNNTSATAASASTDLNGAAAVRACRQIKRRLRAFAAQLFATPALGIAASPRHIRFREGYVVDVRVPEQKLSFGELTNAARRERVDMGARGFYATPGIDFNRETGKGNPFSYFTQGAAVAAVAEVLIDRFTGQLSIPRVDLLIDIGKSINPGIDRGQVTGGFIQGMGWVTTEQLCYDEHGDLLSHSPTTYKIPAITDVPKEFNIAFLETNDNVRNIRRSKAVGEPPLLLGIAAWTAVKHALTFATPGDRSGLSYPPQNSTDARNVRGDSLPATNEVILRQITELESQTPSFARNSTTSTTKTQRTPRI
jgi:xanthine dehydrogenase large subunit